MKQNSLILSAPSRDSCPEASGAQLHVVPCHTSGATAELHTILGEAEPWFLQRLALICECTLVQEPPPSLTQNTAAASANRFSYFYALISTTVHSPSTQQPVQSSLFKNWSYSIALLWFISVMVKSKDVTVVIKAL